MLGVPTLSGAGRTRLADGAPLVGHSLLEVGASGPWLGRRSAAPDRVVSHLAGARHPDRVLEPLILAPTPLDLPGATELARALEQGAGFAWVHSPPAVPACPWWSAPWPVWASGSLCVAVPPDVAGGADAFVRTAVREAALTNRCLVLDGAERLVPTTGPDPAAPGSAATMPPALVDPPVPVIASARRRGTGTGRRMRSPTR